MRYNFSKQKSAVVFLSMGFAASVSLGWPMECKAQMVGPTPQPEGIPISPEEAEKVEPESWAVHLHFCRNTTLAFAHRFAEPTASIRMSKRAKLLI
jgi:hypothetical protein